MNATRHEMSITTGENGAMSESVRYRWNGSRFVRLENAPQTPLLAADSFLVADGGVVALDAHLERFTAATESQGMVFPSSAYLDAFVELIPRTGEWFPRIDFTVRGEIECWMRPAPPRTTSVVLATADHDPRTEPSIKGPDIESLSALRDHARERGADDAVILTPADHEHPGSIVDGATTCLVWWRNDQLVSPPQAATRVASVTAGVLERIAHDRNIETRTEWASLEDLSNTTVWAINALHGIRAVSAWLDGPRLSSDDELLSAWRESYDRARKPIST